MKISKKIALTVASLMMSTSLYAISNTQVDLEMKNYKDLESFKKIDNVLTSVKEEGLTKNIKINSQKWEDVNSLLSNLINKKNYKDAYVLFKHIDFDNNIKEYKSHLRFFQIINKMYSNNTSFERINEIKSNNLLNHVYNYFFDSLEKEKIKDITIVSKLNSSLLEINNEVFSFDEKQRVRYKLKLIEGKYIEALSIIYTLSKQLQEDKMYLKNIKYVLSVFQENFFVENLQMTHKDFKDFNILYRSNKN